MRPVLPPRTPLRRAVALTGVAAPLLALAAWLGHLSTPTPTPTPPGPAPEVWFSSLAPDAGPAAVEAVPGLHPRLPPPTPVAPRVAAAAPTPAPDLSVGLHDQPLPVALPRAAPPTGAPLAFIPAPPPRPARPAPAASPAAGDLATRLIQPPGATAALDLGAPLAAPSRGLIRSPIPPRRPADAAGAPVVLAALSPDAPPARPAAPAFPDLPALSGRTGAEGCGPALTRAIPRRPTGAEGGRAVAAAVQGTRGSSRDAALIRAIERGNIPDHLRGLVPVTLTGTGPDGRPARVTICVMPDYLAVGSDRDFVRVPLGLPAAQRLADRFDMLLPTAEMVDAIHAQARVRLAPQPMTPGAQMESTAYFVTHNATVEAQRRATGAGLGALVSGHKKDLVLTNRLTRVAGRVAIYGWHRTNGRPIQPLSTVHGQNYADYSHGVRLISRTAFLNGRAVDLADLLSDRRYAGVLAGDEGPLTTRALLAALR